MAKRKSRKSLQDITAKGRGKTFRRSLEAAENRVRDYDEYFIRRGGGWFRPGAHGYTIDLADAGVFLGKEARGYLNAEGVLLRPKQAMIQTIQKAACDHLSAGARLMGMISSF